MGELGRAYASATLGREAVAEVTATPEHDWTAAFLLDKWALVPLFVGPDNKQAIAVRDHHARLLVRHFSTEERTAPAEEVGSVSRSQLLTVLAGLDPGLFEVEDEVVVKWSEDYGTYVFVW